MLFEGRTVLAIDAQGDFAVNDVVKPQQWCLDITDAEPDWADVVTHKQDVFVSVEPTAQHRCHRVLPSNEEILEVNPEDVLDSAG